MEVDDNEIIIINNTEITKHSRIYIRLYKIFHLQTIEFQLYSYTCKLKIATSVKQLLTSILKTTKLTSLNIIKKYYFIDRSSNLKKNNSNILFCLLRTLVIYIKY